MYAMLPVSIKYYTNTFKKKPNSNHITFYQKSLVETLKTGGSVPAKSYESLTFLTADICGLSSLMSRVSPGEVMSLMNIVFTALDEALDGFEDVNKIETISDAWCLVSGVGADGKSGKATAANMVALGQTLLKVARELDLTGQVQDSVHIRIGVHSGPAVGGIVNPTLPKFNVFGDAPTISSMLETTSKPMGLHISGATYDLVKDRFECDVSESLNFTSGGKTARIPTFWVNETSEKRKGRGGRGTAQ